MNDILHEPGNLEHTSQSMHKDLLYSLESRWENALVNWEPVCQLTSDFRLEIMKFGLI